MEQPCCRDLETFSRSRSDREASAALAALGADLSQLPDPLVRFVPELGIYTIKSVAIYYCPWCGARLPEPPEMRCPPPSLAEPETALSAEEIADAPCTHLARRAAQELPGVSMDTEQVSLSPEFGHVYRYDIVELIGDDGAAPRVRSVLIVWSKNGEACNVATCPAFDLPLP
jgi:hypothetical protein